MQSSRISQLLVLRAIAFLLLLARCMSGVGKEEGSRISVGIMTQGAFWKGLFRDAEIVAWGLQTANGDRVPSISIFYTRWFKDAEAAVRARGTYEADALEEGARGTMLFDLAVPEGTNIREWLGSLDVFISFESPLLAIFELAESLGVSSSILILNVDWACAQELHRISKIRNLKFWVKGPGTETAVRQVLAGANAASESAGVEDDENEKGREEGREGGKRSKDEEYGVDGKTAGVGEEQERVLRVPWTIPDPVVRFREPNAAGGRSLPVTFLMIVGMGGVQSRRGVDVALKAFYRAMEMAGDGMNAQFLLSSTLFPFPVEEQLLEHANVSVVYQVHAREELSELLAEADAVLYPSRWEGFGLSMMEALHAGVPVLATDGWPMDEIVEDNVNGLLLKAKLAGNFFADDHKCTIKEFPEDSCKEMLAPHWEVDVEDMARAIVRFSTDEELRRRLTAPRPHLLQSRQFAFKNTLQALVMAGRHPQSVILKVDREEPRRRRRELSEVVERLEEGLQAVGYAVRQSSAGEEVLACSDLLLVVASLPADKDGQDALVRTLRRKLEKEKERKTGQEGGKTLIILLPEEDQADSSSVCSKLRDLADAVFVDTRKGGKQNLCSLSLPNASSPPSHQIADILALSSLRAAAGRGGKEQQEQDEHQDHDEGLRPQTCREGGEHLILALDSSGLFDQVVDRFAEFFLDELARTTTGKVSVGTHNMLRTTTFALLKSCRIEEATRLEALSARLFPCPLSPCALALVHDDAMLQTFLFRLQRTVGPSCTRRLQQVWSSRRHLRTAIAEALCREPSA